MFKVLKLGHVEFEVQDLARMTDYYREVMGLTVQIAPLEARDVVHHLESRGARAEIRTANQPSIPEVVRTSNPDGVPIELYSQFEPADHAYSFRGINPVKLAHVAALTPDPQRLMAFYIDELGFRLSDSARDFFFFCAAGPIITPSTC
jgi:hypothetical protein